MPAWYHVPLPTTSAVHGDWNSLAAPGYLTTPSPVLCTETVKQSTSPRELDHPFSGLPIYLPPPHGSQEAEFIGGL